MVDFGADTKKKIRNYIVEGSFYVAVTRVRSGTKLFLKSFERSYIKTNKEIKEKIIAMRKFKPYINKKIYIDETVFKDPASEIKIGYLNINGVDCESHSHYLNHDHNLKNLNMLVLSETKIQKDYSDSKLESDLDDWNIIQRYDAGDGSKHMGLLLLTSKTNDIKDEIESVKEMIIRRSTYVQCQGILVKLRNKQNLGFIYCRTTPNVKEIEKMKKMFANCDVLMGDMNLSHRIEEEKRKIRTLCEPTKFSALTDITRSTSNNQLDYILLENKFKDSYLTGSFFNFISDHKSIFLRLPLSQSNKLTDEIKEKLTFDHELHLKKRRKQFASDDEDDLVEEPFDPPDLEESEMGTNNRIVEFRHSSVESHSEMLYRRFHNQDLATCWLNSCLQLLLLAMDHDAKETFYYSELGRELETLKTQHSDIGLDPTIVKNILVSTEDERIALRLSELQNEVDDERELERLIEATHNSRLNLLQGQQCVRDFFVCLSQNEASWPDVASLLSFEMTSATTCGICKYSSQSTAKHSHHEIPVPQNNSNLATFVENLFNEGIHVDNNCSSCNEHYNGIQRKTLTNVSKTQFKVIFCPRYLQTIDGLELIDNKVNSTGDVMLR